jgi:hypothetical protein
MLLSMFFVFIFVLHETSLGSAGACLGLGFAWAWGFNLRGWWFLNCFCGVYIRPGTCRFELVCIGGAGRMAGWG